MKQTIGRTLLSFTHGVNPEATSDSAQMHRCFSCIWTLKLQSRGVKLYTNSMTTNRIENPQVIKAIHTDIGSNLARTQLRVIRVHHWLAAMLWLFAVSAAFALPYGAAHGSAKIPVLERLCVADDACQHHPDQMPSCTSVDHAADHQAVPPSAKPPVDALLSAVPTFPTAVAAPTASMTAADRVAHQTYLLTHRLRL